MSKLYITISFLFCFAGLLSGQQSVIISGHVYDRLSNDPVDFVTVFIDGTQVFSETDQNGFYRIEIEPGNSFTLVYSRIGYDRHAREVVAQLQGTRLEIDVYLIPSGSDLEVIVTERILEEAGVVREDVEPLKLIPSTTGNLEAVLPSIALGASSGTGGELSSQYNVRGGNYDENLVYVNDFEVYRPQLIRSSQQEGLSFPNIDLMRDLSFSSGGFETRYGDKLSSVLDIRYKIPDSLRASLGLSLLGGSAHVEGSIPGKLNNYKSLRYLVGARYKTTKYLLSSLDVKGEYTPSFIDIQGYVTYDLNRDLQLGVIGNYNSSIYDFKPVSSEVAQGLIDFALRLSTQFEGQEVDDFITGMGGVSLTYIPDRSSNPLFLKFLASTYQSEENETFDIIGSYRLSQIETNIGNEDAGEEILVLGTGIQHGFTRNFLNANVSNVALKGGIELQGRPDTEADKSHFLQWGFTAQREYIFDKINEWERLDSAGYSLNYDPTEVRLRSVFKTKNELTSYRFSSYFQDSYTILDQVKGELKLTGGIRTSYWSLNKEFIVSPRVQILYKPHKSERDISYRFAAGLYHQPPFYREMRRPNGEVNSDLLTQKSFHIVGGWTMDFGKRVRGRKKFRMITEMYYKYLWDLVSYEVENVRIRYSGENDATGYVAGIDVRLNGEFVPGAESWVNISFLRAHEKIQGVTHLRRDIGDPEAREVNSVPRPTDQFFNLNVFFQDYLPRNENFKMHLNLAVGTGLPFGLKDNNVIYRNTYRYKPYHRVDIGFSAQLWDREWTTKKPNHPLRFTRNSWASLEIYNLMQIRNEASKTWIKAITNQQFAISNFLTSRRINLRLKFDF